MHTERITTSQEAYGKDSLSNLYMFRWHKAFTEGREKDIDGDQRAGRPSELQPMWLKCKCFGTLIIRCVFEGFWSRWEVKNQSYIKLSGKNFESGKFIWSSFFKFIWFLTKLRISTLFAKNLYLSLTDIFLLIQIIYL